MNFFTIANSPLLFILVIIGLLIILAYSVIFLIKGYRRCLELGISKSGVNNVIRSSLAFSFVPSLSIVVGFFALAAALGTPWPWWRLSILGSVIYETMAASTAASGMGYTDLHAMSESNDPRVFGAVMLVMTLGIIAGLVFVLIPFGKKLTTGLITSSSTENTWKVVRNSCFMLTLAAVFLPIMVLSDPVNLATLLTSAAITILLAFLAKKLKAAWLNNFILAFSLILSMAAALLWKSLLV